jgi:hypothetical protein
MKKAVIFVIAALAVAGTAAHAFAGAKPHLVIPKTNMSAVHSTSLRIIRLKLKTPILISTSSPSATPRVKR